MPPAENGESPSLNLPPPVMETGAAVEVTNSDAAEPETLAPSAEAASSPKTAILSNPPVQQIDFPGPLKTSTTSPPVASSTTNIVVPVTADDGDLIEKEWVLRAKRIVESNRDNPYNQSKEMTLFRADYMKKRYNKIINISE